MIALNSGRNSNTRYPENSPLDDERLKMGSFNAQYVLHLSDYGPTYRLVEKRKCLPSMPDNGPEGQSISINTKNELDKQLLCISSVGYIAHRVMVSIKGLLGEKGAARRIYPVKSL